MANIAKYKRSAVGHMFAHYDRKMGENVKRGNEEIDPTRTYLNYDIHTGEKATDERGSKGKQIDRLNERLSQVKHRNFSSFDDNLFADWVVTLPKDVPAEKSKEFFQHVYDFASKRYGKENVISAWVHMDETTPHIHFCFVPVVKGKDGTEKLCAKEVINKIELSKFHPELQRYVEEKMGTTVGILNGTTAGGNLTITELKLKKALTELTKAKAEKTSLDMTKEFTQNFIPFMEEAEEAFHRLDNDLKAKKWFGDNDKAKMKALFKDIEVIRKKAESVTNIAEKVFRIYEETNEKTDRLMEEAYSKVRESSKDAMNRIKRTERKLAKKEKSIDEEVDSRVQSVLSNLQNTIDEKKEEISRLDIEARQKEKRLQVLDRNLWGNQELLRMAKRNEENFLEAIKEWGNEYESKNAKSEYPDW